jgi:hypothetical protein
LRGVSSTAHPAAARRSRSACISARRSACGSSAWCSTTRESRSRTPTHPLARAHVLRRSKMSLVFPYDPPASAGPSRSVAICTPRRCAADRNPTGVSN